MFSLIGLSVPNSREGELLVQALMKMPDYVRGLKSLGSVEASREIKVDGYLGPQTHRFILAFEAYARGRRRLLVADGVFEPSSTDGFTILGHSEILVTARYTDATDTAIRILVTNRQRPLK